MAIQGKRIKTDMPCVWDQDQDDQDQGTYPAGSEIRTGNSGSGIKMIDVKQEVRKLREQQQHDEEKEERPILYESKIMGLHMKTRNQYTNRDWGLIALWSSVLGICSLMAGVLVFIDYTLSSSNSWLNFPSSMLVAIIVYLFVSFGYYLIAKGYFAYYILQWQSMSNQKKGDHE